MEEVALVRRGVTKEEGEEPSIMETLSLHPFSSTFFVSAVLNGGWGERVGSQKTHSL